MKVLVVYTSLYGATQGIAERIAATLGRHGLEVTVQPASRADNPAHYDAAVIGSATYYFRWMHPSREFVERHRGALAERPVWLFSSGPLGTNPNDAQGRDLRDVLEPREIAGLRETIHPRDHRVFFDALDHGKLKFTHRILQKLPANRGDAVFPQGDFRDWNDIEQWAAAIAEALIAQPALVC